MNEVTEQSKLELAKSAIDYVLQRIQKDENIRYHMGAFTEAFERLKAASAALNNISAESIEEDVFSLNLKRKPCAEQICEIKDLLNAYSDHSSSEVTTISKIAAVVGS